MKKAEIERKEKQAKLEEDLSQRLQEKQAELADLDKKATPAYDALLVAMERAPYKSENPKTKELYIKLVNKYLAQIKFDASLDAFLNKISPDQITNLLEVVLKNLQYVSDGTPGAANPTLLLKLYSHILDTKGVSYQLRATSKKYPL